MSYFRFSETPKGGFENPLYTGSQEPMAEVGEIEINVDAEPRGDKTKLTYGSWMSQAKKEMANDSTA